MAKGLHLVAMVQYQGAAENDAAIPWHADFLRIDKDRSSENGDAFHETNLSESIRARGIHRVLVAGLTTQNGVRETVMGSLREGFETWLLMDGVADQPADVPLADRALIEMRSAGAAFASVGQIATLIKHQQEPTALVAVGIQSFHGPGGTEEVPGAKAVFDRIGQLIEFGCRQIHRRPEEILA
ncbi:isochorismatase family protein [bacterium]|nr:isochorismatase family protein [bacterium]